MKPRLVTQPLHGGAGNEDRAFERIGRHAIEAIGNGRQQPVCRGDPVGAGIEKRKAAGAIGRFHHARFEAGVTDNGSLLITGDAEDRNFRAQKRLVRYAEIGSAIKHLRQHGAGNVEDGQQFVIPGIVLDIVDQRSRGIGSVGHMAATAGEAIDQETVDRAEADFALHGFFAKAADAVEKPFQLRAGKVGVEQQTSLFGKERLQSPSFQILANWCSTAILPDNGPMHGLACITVPQHGRFALVGDADRLDIGSGDTGIGKRQPNCFKHAFPDILGIVFDPAGGWEMLRKFSLPTPMTRMSRSKTIDLVDVVP